MSIFSGNGPSKWKKSGKINEKKNVCALAANCRNKKPRDNKKENNIDIDIEK